jgi:hypothetical protein
MSVSILHLLGYLARECSVPSLLQAATNVTKHTKRPREKNDSFIIAELLTSINNVYTADVANFQLLANLFDEFVEIVYSRGQSLSHYCRVAAQLHMFRAPKRAILGRFGPNGNRKREALLS